MRKQYVHLLCIFLTQIASAYGGQLRWEKRNDSLALLNDGKIVWCSNHAIGAGKPSIHPLSLVDGTALTAFRPADHPWHRGVWFAWKYIRGANFWEERHDGQSQGITEVLSVKVRTGLLKHSARIKMALSYHMPQQPALITETRSIEFSKPKQDGYSMEWESAFKVGEKDISLDRTAIPGEQGEKDYGGYAGFSFRAARETLGWKFKSSSDLDGKRGHGQPARWMTFSGKTVDGKTATIVIFDHPSNPRHPTCWYISEKMPYFSPAILYAAPLILKPNAEFTLKYLLLVKEGVMTDDDLLKTWNEWKE